jgi:hypothetical protein
MTPDTVEEANEHPEVSARKTVGQVAEHYTDVIGKLEKRAAVIGHPFGGPLAQMIAGRGLSAAAVAIDSAPVRGVLPLPVSALRAAAPVLGNPASHHRAVPLIYDQFRYASADALSEEDAKDLYATYAVPPARASNWAGRSQEERDGKYGGRARRTSAACQVLEERDDARNPAVHGAARARGVGQNPDDDQDDDDPTYDLRYQVICLLPAKGHLTRTTRLRITTRWVTQNEQRNRAAAPRGPVSPGIP